MMSLMKFIYYVVVIGLFNFLTCNRLRKALEELKLK